MFTNFNRTSIRSLCYRYFLGHIIGFNGNIRSTRMIIHIAIQVGSNFHRIPIQLFHRSNPRGLRCLLHCIFASIGIYMYCIFKCHPHRSFIRIKLGLWQISFQLCILPVQYLSGDIELSTKENAYQQNSVYSWNPRDYHIRLLKTCSSFTGQIDTQFKMTGSCVGRKCIQIISSFMSRHNKPKRITVLMTGHCSIIMYSKSTGHRLRTHSRIVFIGI